MKNNSIEIKFDSVTLRFKERVGYILSIFEKLSFVVNKGERIGIFGPSGSGKTSLFFLILGLIRPSSGTISISSSIQLIPQIPILDPWLTCEEILEISNLRKNANKEIHETLKDVGLYNQKNQLVTTLSGGEKQRLTVAASLITGKKILLADEPFGRLDLKSTYKTRDFLLKIAEEKKLTLLLATHSTDHLESLDRIFEIKNRSLLELNRNKH
ncbi:MAG: putative ABC transporter ATP-binding protein YxlF [Candidatus Heimdallarchaeota archaeon LC_3]|nr:MAG: putative ABC transporter ATP-binding protein YxlF [Candidatus Heimdallarchaeota archaeon LC_3]